MSTSQPLPFRISSPGRDTLGLEGIKSVSYHADGMLQLNDGVLTMEWTETRTTEQVSLERIGTDVDAFPPEWLELPVDRLAGAWVIGGWWRPRLEVRVRAPEDLESVPGARGITVRLHIQRRDRRLAQAIASEIEGQVSAHD
jgi:hypothetical protein